MLTGILAIMVIRTYEVLPALGFLGIFTVLADAFIVGSFFNFLKNPSDRETELEADIHKLKAKLNQVRRIVD